MLRQRVNGYDMAYIDIGSGDPLVCIHGSLGDFRTWSPVLGPLSQRHRVIVPSLRRFFPEHWDGTGGGFTIAQHVADVIAFLEALGGPTGGKLNLLGHSRGGHIAFRVAQQRPELLRRLVLAEPGGDLDASLATGDSLPAFRSHVAAAVETIAAGDIEGGVAKFVDAINGPGVWRSLAATARQQLRDNARTLLGQVNEQRPPYSRTDAESIRVPALFIGGAKTPGALPVVLRALAAHVPGAKVEIIPNATHAMFEDDPVRFSKAVVEFLGSAG
nr:alpha/beta hydrolase [uncultured Rhodopila sp.]